MTRKELDAQRRDPARWNRQRQTAFLLATLSLTAQVVAAQGAPSWQSEQVQIARAPGIIAGTLIVPSGTARMPLVVIIAGSGPTDRDGNSGVATRGPNSLRQLAESLATQGIASVRYDKRSLFGSASSGTKESDLRFETLAADAAAWVRRYHADERFNRIIVLGHSEGALLGLLAVLQTNADGYVSLEGPARRADDIIRDQLADAQVPAALRARSDTIMAAIRAGQTVTPVPPELAALFRLSVQPYLTSWFHYSAAEEIGRLKVPCLIVQGTADFQVMPSEAPLLKAANPSCETLQVDGMNHVLKKTPAGRMEQMNSYYDPSLPLAPGLVKGLVSFVRAVEARP
jgi:pimeloyl-ACP methyl ester carboxylesterase